MAPQIITENNTSANSPLPTENSSPLSADLVQVDDKIYSVKELADSHPGGEFFVKAFAGRDATEAFLSYHRKSFPHNRLSQWQVSSAEARKEKDADADYLELCALVEKIIPRHKSFAPISYYFKLAAILTSAICLEAYMHATASYVWYLSALLGFLMALIGLNIQHDANHGAISSNPLINRILGYTQNWIGGSSLDWVHQHVVQHHVETNDVHHDPDIAGSDILRLNPLRPLLKHQLVQHIYLFGLITLFGHTMVVSTAAHLLQGVQFTPYSKQLNFQRKIELFFSFAFALRWFALPLWQVPSLYTLLHIAPMFAVAGYYLAFFFILSHNFIGVHMYDRSQPQHKQSFLYRQVATSSNVGGSFLCFINGGLNYQIEHHLFPRIQHTHYPRIAPLVKEFCAKKNIPYTHFPTVYDNFVSCVQHLQSMGSKDDPIVYKR